MLLAWLTAYLTLITAAVVTALDGDAASVAYVPRPKSRSITGVTSTTEPPPKWYDGGKHDARPHTCPCCVSLRDEHGHFATGVIIDEYVVASIRHHRIHPREDAPLTAYAVAGTDDAFGNVTESVAAYPRMIYLDNQEETERFKGHDDAGVALWALDKPLVPSQHLRACARLSLADYTKTPNHGVLKGWILHAHGDMKEESRKLKNYNASIVPMKNCNNMPEELFICARYEPKEISCMARDGLALFAEDGKLLGFQINHQFGECDYGLLTRIPVTDKWIEKTRKRGSGGRRKLS